MRRLIAAGAVATTVAGSLAVSSLASAAPVGGAGPAAAASTAGPLDYLVLAAEGADREVVRRAVAAAGGTVVSENNALGTFTVTSSDPAFRTRMARSTAVEGIARNRVIGTSPGRARPDRGSVERLAAEAARARGLGESGPAALPPLGDREPLAGRQWDMRQIGATPEGSYAVHKGDSRVLVGIIDTGIDGSHPDIAPNFDAQRSRNFTHDIPLVDGPCSEEPDKSCSDPADVDEADHGTHVASTIGAPVNGIGIAGVAPEVTLVNLRAGQDSGYFFLEPTLNAMTYAADQGIDVVNMSYFTDPWLFNCRYHPADSLEDRVEQRAVIRATQRAADYARSRGVTLVAAEGNEGLDLNLDRAYFDEISPDFPPETARGRWVTNACIQVPTETEGVITVAATGPSTRKSYFSNFGTEETDVAAPGGDYYDASGTPDPAKNYPNMVLAAYPLSLALARGEVERPGGPPTAPNVVRSCANGQCSYYQYLQGTSMAAPHAAGVAALIVSRYGGLDRAHPGGIRLDPARTEAILYRTARDHACPTPRDYTYVLQRTSGTVTFSHGCEGPAADNGFYGHGIVNALAAVG